MSESTEEPMTGIAPVLDREQESRPGSNAEQPHVGITPRAVIIGFVSIIPGVFWGVYGDVVSQTDLTSISLMMPPVLLLTALLVINVFIKRINPRWVLRQGELITIYAMLTVSVVLSGMGMLQFLCTTLGAVPRFATPENNWNQYLEYVPRSILPKLSAIEGFYVGDSPIPWGAWTRPLILWSGFFLSMLFCMLCINTIFRKQWVDRERLTFPIVQLPLEMTDPKTSFFSNRLMWLGFGVAVALESMNSLNFLYPNVPYVQLRAFDLSKLILEPPWSRMGNFATTYYPLAIGLGFVLSAEVSFSCWFFFILTKLENVAVYQWGWTAGPGAVSSPPYLAHQGFGAFIGIAIVAVYLARHHLMDVFAKAFQRKSDVDDSEEPMGYETAVIGLMLGFLAMMAFCFYVGMSPWLSLVYLGLYLIFSTTIARLRAEAGPAWTMGPSINAMDSIVQSIGAGKFGTQNMVALAYFNWFSLEMRCCPMPAHIEAMKMAQSARIRQRAMTLVMICAIVVGVAVGFWACLAVWYKFGAGTAMVEPWRTNMGRVPFERITNYMANPNMPDVPGMMAMGFGTLMTFFLSAMRSKFIWFPFHPAGYVLGNTQTMNWLWCPFLIAWICKVVITKYGGIKAYRRALPFFLGLVFGDYIASSLWALAGSLLGIKMYRCFPC